MEHLNESISAGERGWRTSRSSVLLTPPGPRSPVHTSPPKVATPGPPSRQLSTSPVPTLPEEPLESSAGGKVLLYLGLYCLLV